MARPKVKGGLPSKSEPKTKEKKVERVRGKVVDSGFDAKGYNKWQKNRSYVNWGSSSSWRQSSSSVPLLEDRRRR